MTDREQIKEICFMLGNELGNQTDAVLAVTRYFTKTGQEIRELKKEVDRLKAIIKETGREL